VVRWSMGFFGDLVWDLLPEVRPHVEEMISYKEAYSAKIHDLVDQGLTCEYSIGSPDDHAH
jgi:hypothetical protein